MDHYKPIAEYYKDKGIVCHNQSGFKNNAILIRLERDLTALHSDIMAIKDDISIIKQYILQKKAREDKAWF